MNDLTIQDKIAILDTAWLGDFSKTLKGKKGIARIEYIENCFNNIRNLEELIKIYNEECIEEQYYLDMDE